MEHSGRGLPVVEFIRRWTVLETMRRCWAATSSEEQHRAQLTTGLTDPRSSASASISSEPCRVAPTRSFGLTGCGRRCTYPPAPAN
jgi:hypothetical protein